MIEQLSRGAKLSHLLQMADKEIASLLSRSSIECGVNALSRLM